MITHYTEKQLEVEKLVNKFGFMTELEKVFGIYCVDIWVPELDWVIEVDGPQHYEKRDFKRDQELFEMGVKFFTHIKVSDNQDEMKSKLQNAIDRMCENNGTRIEKGTVEYNKKSIKQVLGRTVNRRSTRQRRATTKSSR